jgi:hypothetical protein
MDAMRDMMDIELLLRDFTATPDNPERWLTATDDERWNPHSSRCDPTANGKLGRVPAQAVDYQAVAPLSILRLPVVCSSREASGSTPTAWGSSRFSGEADRGVGRRLTR